MSEPTSLQEAIVFFNDAERALQYFIARRWPNGVTCPTCGSQDVRFLANQSRWECKAKHAKKQFSAKSGTIFAESAVPLEKWLCAVWLITNAKNGISSWELHRSLGITQKTAWFMLHRIRLGMQDTETGGKLGGEIEVDETFIGGKSRNMHTDVRSRRIPSAGTAGKIPVLGILERGGKIRTKVVRNTKRKSLQTEVRKHVEAGSEIHSDALKSYEGLSDEYVHQVVDHAVEYVRGNVHTNGLENFWSLLKRGLGGTYISTHPYHLFRYLDEQCFRYNHRKDLNDGDRFNIVLGQLAGKRLTYQTLTGKTADNA